MLADLLADQLTEQGCKRVEPKTSSEKHGRHGSQFQRMAV